MKKPSPQKFIFVLPEGFSLGGVSTWSAKMIRQIAGHDLPASLIRHTELEDAFIDKSLESLNSARVIRCPGVSPWWASIDDVFSYIPAYNSALPGTIIPNYSFSTYAACALLSLTNSHNMRIIGLAHCDEDIYYETLQRYESIIHIFVAVSTEIEVKLKNLMPHRESDIFMRSCPVDSPTQLSRSYSTSSEPINLMYGGRLVNTQKRVYDLVNLVRILEKEKTNFHLSIVGTGSDEDWLKKEFDSLYDSSTSQRVTFEGSVNHNQMSDYWKANDVCILVSEFEGSSISMLEAMSQGCVPIVTKVSGTNAVICHGENGFVVPVGDMSKMACIIQSLSQDKKQLQQIGTEAHNFVSRNEIFSFENYFEWFLHLNELAWEKSPRLWNPSQTLFPEKQQQPPVSLPRRVLNRLCRFLL
jgi:glycosyltransferase involved in cell wall biosynthesis